MSTRGRRWRHGHHVVAVMLLNTALLLVAVEAALAVVFWMKDRRGVVVDMYDGLDDATLATLYPHRRREDVAGLWKESVQPLVYEPFTEFRERPRRGTWVNVDSAGFRYGENQSPWPPDPHRTNVFVFGGSTTFGYGVADDDTIPSRLQPLLAHRQSDVSVFNFARGYYYSTQEHILFEQLLRAGHVPAVAIFIDGLNDFCFSADDSTVTPRLAAALEARARTSLLDWVSGTSVGRAVAFVQTRIGRAAPEPTPAELSDDEIRHIIDRYLENKRLIEAVSAAYGVTPVFVWQPVPMYHYDPQYHLFATRGFFGVTRVRRGYEAMAAGVAARPVGGHFVWLADVQKDAHEPLYVDIVHYAPPFAARLAALIDAEVGDLVVRTGAGRRR
jgi:hypothetical protein